MPSTEITDREPGSGYGAKRIDGGSTEDHQAIPSRPAGFLMVPALFPPSRIDENRRWHFLVDLLRSQMITLGLKLCVCEGGCLTLVGVAVWGAKAMQQINKMRHE